MHSSRKIEIIFLDLLHQYFSLNSRKSLVYLYLFLCRSSHTTSSSSDGSEKGTGSPSVSRNASFLSQRSILSSVSRAPSISRKAPPPAPQPAAKPKSEIAQQTVTTLMGGRGYVHMNGGNPNSSSVPSSGSKSNYRDATLVIWDQKA